MIGTVHDIQMAAENTADDPTRRAPLVLGNVTYDTITTQVSGIALADRAAPTWKILFVATSLLLLLLIIMLLYLGFTGVGVFGNNIPVAWAFPITNFVWWIGIGHAGTLISAVLYLLRQKWRNSINRFAEAMTICAVVCAGLFPVIHLGRLWLAYWIAPYPNQMRVWPNFSSPLVWDAFAVSTYFTVSLLFWYLGMVPDLATLRVKAVTRTKRRIYGLLSLGWRGSARHWRLYEFCYLLLAGLATPLVLSVHSIVSFDFSVAQLPGWHSTIFPPYFVAGAIFSGFAMVLTLIVPARWFFNLQNLITPRHIDNMCKVLLAHGLMVTYAYCLEFFNGWWSQNPFEQFLLSNRQAGPYGWITDIMMFCNVIVPNLFWFKWARRNMAIVFVVSILVNVGMWLERYVIIVTGLHRDFLPSSWHMYSGTWVDYCTLAGSMGLFLFLFLLFCRYLPMMSMAEIKELVPAQPPVSVPDWHLPTAQDPGSLYAIAGQFPDPESLVAAARAVRQQGYTHWDCLTPFPVRHLAEAMGPKPKLLGWMVFLAGVCGTATALFFQYWFNGLDYPIVVSGKPYWGIPANIPVDFELTILFAALTAFFGLFAMIRLPRLYHPLMNDNLLRRGLIDSFFVVIERQDPHFQSASDMLRSLGAITIREVQP